MFNNIKFYSVLIFKKFYLELSENKHHFCLHYLFYLHKTFILSQPLHKSLHILHFPILEMSNTKKVPPSSFHSKHPLHSSLT